MSFNERFLNIHKYFKCNKWFLKYMVLKRSLQNRLWKGLCKTGYEKVFSKQVMKHAFQNRLWKWPFKTPYEKGISKHLMKKAFQNKFSNRLITSIHKDFSQDIIKYAFASHIKYFIKHSFWKHFISSFIASIDLLVLF